MGTRRTEAAETGRPWTRLEDEAAIADYLDMLIEELSGRPVNKAEHNRRLRAVLTERSKGSIEFKHANISAAMIDLGYRYVDGYKPRPNYQDLLRRVIEFELPSGKATLEQTEYGHPGRLNPWEPRHIDARLQPKTEALRAAAEAIGGLVG